MTEYKKMASKFIKWKKILSCSESFNESPGKTRLLPGAFQLNKPEINKHFYLP